MAVQIQFRRDTAAAWTAANPTLAAGELGLETDTSLYKIGNGSTAWNSLAYGTIAGVPTSNSITTAMLQNSAVTATKLASDAVTTAKILDSNVTTAKIADDAVTQVKLADRVVGSAELDNLTLNAQTGTTYTLVLADAHKLVTQSNASAITTTIPPNTDVAFQIGDQVNLLQLGAGQVTVAPGSGVTIRSEGTKLKLKGQYAAATCIKIASDEWVLVGNLSA
jgi:Major tropism determinant N-terminal domain